MINWISVAQVLCDRCGDGWGGECPPLFTDLLKAHAHLLAAGWRVRPHRYTCPPCLQDDPTGRKTMPDWAREGLAVLRGLDTTDPEGGGRDA